MGKTHPELADRSRWQARPALARVLSLTVFVIPLVGAYVVTRLVSPLVTPLPVVSRVLLLGVVAVVVGLTAERFLRRVLPLAALLRMTMLFPDRAPSRFKLARATGNTRILEERAQSRPGETAGEAATRILGLLSSLSAHDRRTRGHSERVRVFTDVLAEELHLPQEARDRLRWAALLHDLGKVDVPASILNKPAALDAQEWEQIRRHPDRGAVLAGSLLGWLDEWGAAISQHHERFDGKGYPRGLAGHEIALAGRIVAVADSFEVMTAARSYKRPMSVRAARRELADVAGTQLDPACVRAFLGAGLPRVLWAVGPLALLANLPFLRSLAEVGRVVEQAGATAASQAATAAVAATTAVVVVASPGVSTAATADRQADPRPPTHSRTSAPGTSAKSSPSADRRGRSASPGASRPAAVTVTRSSDSGSRSDPTVPGQPPANSTSPTTSGAAPVPTTSASVAPTHAEPSPSATADPSTTSGASSTPTPTSTPTTTPSATATPTPTPTPTPSNSGGSNSGSQKPSTPTITGVSLALLGMVTVSFKDADSGVTFQCRVDGGSWSVCSSPKSYSGLSAGKHTFEVQAVNSAGKPSESAKKKFTIIL